MDHINALRAGTRLQEYVIRKVLGVGGFGITYRADDTNLNKVVAIKEYLPSEFATRTNNGTVVPNSSADTADYQWGLDRFLDEARALARFDHPHLNKVYRFFEGNGTAYMVLEYVEGQTVSQLLARCTTLPAVALQRLIQEVLSGLEDMHAAGYIHRDLKPGNLMVRSDGSAVVLDFGAARQAIGKRSKSVTAVLTPGYAPIEQYATKDESIGPWTDLYALGIVAYRCVSGITEAELPDAVTRSLSQRGDSQDLTPAVIVGKGRYDSRLLAAIDWAIRVNQQDRPQSIAQWREHLPGYVIPTPPTGEPALTEQQGQISDERFEAVWSIPQKSAWQRLKRKAAEVTWQGAHHSVHLAPTEYNAGVSEKLRHLEAAYQMAVGLAAETFHNVTGKYDQTRLAQTINRLRERYGNNEKYRLLMAALDGLDRAGVTSLKKLSEDDLKLMTRKMVFDDLLWTPEQNMKIPFGLKTLNDVARALTRIDAQIAARPDLTVRLHLRNEARDTLTQQMLDAGVLTTEQAKNPHYFRHQIIKYHQLVSKKAGLRKKIKSVFQPYRADSEEAFDTRYYQAEAAWMARAHMDIAAARFLTWLKASKYNHRDAYCAKAVARNCKNLEGILKEDNEARAKWDSLNTEIAKSWDNLVGKVEKGVKKAVRLGVVQNITPGEYLVTAGGLPKNLVPMFNALNAWTWNSMTPENELFDLARWFALEGPQELQAGGRWLLKAVAAYRQWIAETLGDIYLDPEDTLGLLKAFAPTDVADPNDQIVPWQPDSPDGKTRRLHIFNGKPIDAQPVDAAIAKIGQEPSLEARLDAKTTKSMVATLNTVNDGLMIGGEKYEMLLPAGIAETLNNF